MARAIVCESIIDSDDGQDPVPRPVRPPATVRRILSCGDDDPASYVPVESAAVVSQDFSPPPWTSVVPRSQLLPESESDDEPLTRRRRAADAPRAAVRTRSSTHTPALTVTQALMKIKSLTPTLMDS